LLYPFRHNHSSVWKLNLVENDPLGRVLALSIWQSHFIIKNESGKPNLTESKEYHSTPLKVFMTESAEDA
jgi:hypothetical protein